MKVPVIMYDETRARKAYERIKFCRSYAKKTIEFSELISRGALVAALSEFNACFKLKQQS